MPVGSTQDQVGLTILYQIHKDFSQYTVTATLGKYNATGIGDTREKATAVALRKLADKLDQSITTNKG